MKKMKVLGVLTLIGCMLVNPLTVKADYRIADNGYELEVIPPKGATSKENSFGEKEVYDQNGNVITYITASGRVATYGYNENGKTSSIDKVDATGAAFEKTFITYDEFGRPMEEADETGYVLYRYTYNGNVVEKNSTTFSVNDYERWTLDDAQRVRIYENGFRTYSYDFDENGRISSFREIAPDGYICYYEYQYDEKGNVVSMRQHDTHNFDQTYTYINEYDHLGRLVAVTEPELNKITRFQY